LTGGELAAMVIVDAVARMVPGVLANQESGEFESLRDFILEYPQYSRPEVWQGKKVPEILLSGDHARIAQWRQEMALERTRERRPDLYEKYLQSSNRCDIVQ
jgi:tRNA (guanine37-N1)-methyltransferase